MASSWQKPTSTVLTPAGVDVGQLGQVADPHQHRDLGPSSTESRGSGPGCRRSRSRSARGSGRAGGRTPRASRNSTVAVQPVERAGDVGDRHDLHTPVGGPFAVRGVDAQDEVGARLHGPTRPRPGRSCRPRPSSPDRPGERRQSPTPDQGPLGVAADVDPVGPLGDEPSGLVEDLLGREPGGVVDLGEDLDVVVAVALEPVGRAGRGPGGGREGLRGRPRPAPRRGPRSRPGPPGSGPGGSL